MPPRVCFVRCHTVSVESLEQRATTRGEFAVFIQKLCHYLNELYRLDPDWMQDLVNHRPACNENILYSPVQCLGTGAGFVGLLNGFLSMRGHTTYWLGANYEGTQLKGFVVLDSNGEVVNI